LEAGPLSSSQQRQVFVDLPLVESKVQQNHTHGTSACNRNSGSATAVLAAHMMGKEPYMVQMSLSDVRKGLEGDRSFHWGKDLGVPPMEAHFNPGTHCSVMVDVDHYLDMPAFLARYPGTHFISTFQPTATACSTGEYSFRFEEDQRVIYRVSGGAEYRHLVWDYSGDTLLVQDTGALSKTVVSYHIDRKRLDDHHCLIMLTLIGQFESPSFLPTSWLLEGRALSRLRPVFGGHSVLDVVTQAGLFRSVSITGDHESVTLPRAQFDAVRAVALVAKVPITPGMVASNIAPSDPAGLPTERMPPGHAAIMASYLRAGAPRDPPVVYPPSECLVPIWFAKHDYDCPIPLAGFGSPLVGPCYGYATSLASDDRCISGRVESFIDREFEEPIPPTLARRMVEFAERLIPVPHAGHPVGEDEVYDRQDRPSQRSILDEAGVTGAAYKRGWKAFVKKEVAEKPSDPRNISQAPPAAKLAYSKFMYAFHDEVMCSQDWYAFGKTPRQCAERVAAVLKNRKTAVMGDGNRFDGHVKRRMRILERICALRFFAVEHHSAVNECMDEQVGQPGVTTEGRRYKSGYTRGSGSLETSDFNSVGTAFIDYLAHCETVVNGVKCTPDQAWARLGIFGGDDSLSGDIDPDVLVRAARDMGQDYEVQVVRRGELGVNFLNRWFSRAVFDGDTNSMARPDRALAKLWVGPAGLRDPLERFAERCSGYYRMDKNSPVLGEIVTLAHELLGERVDGVLMPWDGKHSPEANWPNVDSGWMVDVFNSAIEDFDWDRFRMWTATMRLVRDPEMLLRAPLCTSAKDAVLITKKPCVVGDEFPLDQASVVVPNQSIDEGGTFLPPKEKEEASEGMTPEPGMPVLVDQPLAQAIAAAKLVPVVGPDGGQVPKRMPKLAAEKKTPADPRNWVMRKQRVGESAAEFAAYQKGWKSLRSKVAKRLGVKLSAPGKGAGQL